jgi:hypothetical protein
MMDGMNRHVLLGIAGWLAVAAAATTAGVAAIDVLEGGITGKNVQPLDDEAVHRALSRTGATPATPRPSPSPSAGALRNLAVNGGTVTARCDRGRVTVVAAIPAQGFRTGGVEYGPAPSVALTFESDSAEYAVTVTCDGDHPVAGSTADDHHGGRDGGGRGRG